MTRRLAVLKGTLDVLVLKSLNWSPMHGFEITAWLEAGAGGELEVDDSAVYQALYRMEKQGLVRAEWAISSATNRRARYYEMTHAGRMHLRVEAERMLRYTHVVQAILLGDAGGRSG